MRPKIVNFYKSDYFFVGAENVQALNLYNHSRIETGGFLRAMLEGDLYKATTYADVSNQQRLHHITKYIVTHLPLEAYGTPERVKKWISTK